MKTKYLMLSILFACISLISFAQSKTDTIKVWGNCEMCKSKIEKAAMAAGAESAEWSENTKQLIVSYDASKTSDSGIQKKIAAVGYDTQDVKAVDAAYKKLDKCCQYKRQDNTSKDTGEMKDMHGMNGTCCNSDSFCKTENCNSADANCGKDCSSCSNTNDCCKPQFGKGYYYIGSSCAILKRVTPTVVITGNTNSAQVKCCI
jgi:mercuric ion binding protein